MRGSVIALALAVLVGVGGCAASSNDAEKAISDQSQGRLSEPECTLFDTDMDERAFECSAAQPGGRRIKLMVFYGNGGDAQVSEWPCLSAGMPWKATRRRALRCGRPLP